MISPVEIKAKAEKKYIAFLQSIVLGEEFSRIVIRGDKNYLKSSLTEFEKEILLLLSQSKEKKGFGYTLEFQRIKTKHIGTQDLPTIIYFNSKTDYLKYLGKEKEVAGFENNLQIILTAFPQLKTWVYANTLKIILKQKQWIDILKVCHYFIDNPKPYRYVRELPIKVHTKFIEQNNQIIIELLNILIAEHANTLEKQFEKRFNLKCSESLVRFKVLDPEISKAYFSRLDDLSIPLSQFEKLGLPLRKVLIVENKTTLYTTLTLPLMKDAIAIFGSGYNVYNLRNVKWFSDVELLYWGDIDAQGFEILSQFREFHPNTNSILMDKNTFEKYFEGDLGTITNMPVPYNLSDSELSLYELLKINNWRLEQEKIPFEYASYFFTQDVIFNDKNT
jgi:hypothetical protein